MHDLLLERTAELTAIDRAVRMARAGCGRQLLITGPAGSGRTVLLERARARAAASGLTVLSADADEREQTFAFALARRLLEGHTAGVPWTRRYEALLELNRLLFATAPALIALDDLHWSDGESLDWLAFVARRLRRTGILLIAGADTGETQLTAPLDEAGAVVLKLQPLSERAVAAIFHVEFGYTVSKDFTRACHRATGGHPLLLSEIAAAAHDCSDCDPSRWLASVVPPGVMRFAERRLKPLAPDARALARGVAVLGPAATLRDAAALAGLDPDGAATACDQLRRAGMLATGDALAITPPLLARALYETILPARRALLHARAARNEPGAVAAARHLLRSEPARDTWVVTTLLRAAERMLELGRPIDAAAYLRRAARERVQPDQAGLLVALAAAERRLGDVAEIGRLETALEHGAPRVATKAALARALLAHGRADDALLLADVDPAELHAGARLCPGAGRVAAARLAAAEGDSPALSACRAAEAACSATSAESAIAQALRAVAGHDLDPEAPAYFSACAALAWADQLTLARVHLDRALAHAERLGSICGLVRAEAGYAVVALRAGEIGAAIVHATKAIGGGGETALAVPARAVLVLALIEADRLDDAAASCDASTPELRYARGQVRLARCDMQGACEDFLAVGDELARDAIEGTPLIPWRSAAALALGSAGEPLAQAEYALATRFGAPRAVGRALRALASVGPPERRTDRFRDAAAVLAPSEARLEYAHALCDLGASLRRERARREAREPLREALDLAVRCGATTLVRRAREELAASGARPRRLAQSGRDALTPAELRVARLAARGLANREIAQTLVVTVKTVETELSHAYAKLGIRSRRDLAGVLAPAG